MPRIGIARRVFLSSLGGLVAAWPLAARAQSGGPMRRIGALMNYAEGDPEGEARVAALRQALHEHGWIDGTSIRIDVRWGQGRAERVKAAAAELASQPLEAIVVNSTPALTALRQATRTIPIVFVQVSDPLGSGFVANIAHPEGNLTGFADYEPSIVGKWIELLKEAAPSVSKAAVLLDPQAGNQMAFWHAAQAAAPAAKLEIAMTAVHNRAEIEAAVAGAAGEPSIGLIVLPTPVNNTSRDTIIKAAAQHRVPAIYPYRYYASDGGLMSYGIDQIDQWRDAAGYVDRILRGDTPANLPVQAPTRLGLWINLATAKALGLDLPVTLLARADEVIE